MCGSLTVIDTARVAPCPWLRDGLARLEHRGPDAADLTEVRLPWAIVSIGMARLKIVDQHDLQLPFQYPHLGITLAYNGEIYNWRDLHAELSPCDWQSNCDAEVLAAAWRRWGPDCLNHFNGMWGFVLVDEQAGEIFIARDRAGLKPVLYMHHDTRLYVSSEAKALPGALSETACLDMECLEYDFGAATPFSGVHRLEPGNYLWLKKPKDAIQPAPMKWWSLPPIADVHQRPYSAAVEETYSLLYDSIKLRGLAEVQVALQLSGGLDSAIIFQILKKIEPELEDSLKLYCIDFAADGIDNLGPAALVAGGTDRLTTLSFTYEKMVEVLPQVVYHLDTPASWSAVCLWFLAQKIAADGSKVVLSGEGADELFGGYSRYRILHWLDQANRDPKLEAYGPTLQYLLGTRRAILSRLLDHSPRNSAILHALELVKRYDGGATSLVSAATRVEFHTTMQLLLRMGDRMAAAFGLENRCPFLDYRLIEMAFRLPPEYLVTTTENKPILRDVARMVGVPKSIIQEKTKRGLAIPWAKWKSAAGRSSMTAGSRGIWDRSGFAQLMRSTWHTSCLRPALCTACDNHSSCR